MSTTPPPAAASRGRPLGIAAAVVLAVGLALTALLLLLPLTAAGVGLVTDTCGSVLVNDDPNPFLGERGCVDALATRQSQALILGVVTLVAAGALGLARLWIVDGERARAREAARG